jgi:hypothetical protein
MSHNKLVERAVKLKEDAHKLQQDAALEGNHDVRDTAKRVWRVLDHNSFADHAPLNPVTPTTDDHRKANNG